MNQESCHLWLNRPSSSLNLGVKSGRLQKTGLQEIGKRFPLIVAGCAPARFPNVDHFSFKYSLATFLYTLKCRRITIPAGCHGGGCILHLHSPRQAGQGHPFELRKPLAKPTARRCATCGADVLAHARGAAGFGVFQGKGRNTWKGCSIDLVQLIEPMNLQQCRVRLKQTIYTVDGHWC